jgi:hypothetical protein
VARRRLDLRGAAEVLGTSVDAVRKRISRGTLESEKADGKVYVWLDDGAPQSDTDALTSAKDETIAVLREQLEAERENLRAERNAHAEARRLLAAALERIPPQLEAPTAPAEPRESPGTPAEGRPSTTGPPEAETPAESRPWWRRIFE